MSLHEKTAGTPSQSLVSTPVRWPTWIAMGLVVAACLFAWQNTLSQDNALVIYFGRPSDAVAYLSHRGSETLIAALLTTSVALGALCISVLLTVVVLTFALRSAALSLFFEQCSVVLQAIPMIALVTVVMIVEFTAFKSMGIAMHSWALVLLPVTLTLFFPSFLYGLQAVADAPREIKGLLRGWNAPQAFRIRQVFLPLALPHILTGARASASWAVIATLIAEGMLVGVPGSEYSLGRALLLAFRSTETGKSLAVILVVTLLGLLVYALARFTERILIRRLLGAAPLPDQKMQFA